jgi:hypothetical protein
MVEAKRIDRRIAAEQISKYLQPNVRCFPKPENLPLIKGYKRDFKAVEVTISGKFIIDYTFAGGAEHVILAIPER